MEGKTSEELFIREYVEADDWVLFGVLILLHEGFICVVVEEVGNRIFNLHMQGERLPLLYAHRVMVFPTLLSLIEGSRRD